MIDLGMRRPGSVIEVIFDTFAGATGASVTMSGLAVTDIEVYKDGSMTQRSDDAGYTLLDTDGIDLDGITGIQGFTIDLANNTVAGFWAAGSRYFIVISSITVDTQVVNVAYATFRIGYRGSLVDTTIATLASQTSFTLAAGSADDDAYNGCAVVAHDVASAVQIAIGHVLDYTGSTKTVTLAADPAIFTMAATDNVSIMPRTDLGAIRGGFTAVANLKTAADAYSATRGFSGTALPAAAADAAGGLPISDAGGLDIDAKLAATNEVTAARMGVLTDWIDGGRLDLLLDTVLTRLSAARAGYLDSLNGNVAQTGDGYAIVASGTHGNAALKALIDIIDTIVDAILVDTGTTLDGRLPAALDGGRMVSKTEVIATNAVDAAAIAADAVAEIAAAIEALLTTSARAEVGAVPAANAALVAKIGWLFLLARNKITNDGTSQLVRNDADSGTVGTAPVSEAAGTVTRGEWA